MDEGRARYFGTGDVGFADRPTISYAPQQGPDVAQTLLKPLSLESIALLTESKWNIDRVFRLAIMSFNGVDNAASAGGPIPECAPEFADFQFASRQLHELVQRRWISVVVTARPKKITTLSNTAGPTVQDAVLAAKEGFGLESEGQQTSVVRSDRQLYLEINPTFVNEPEILELCQNLKLQPGLLEYPISFASGGYFEAINSTAGIDRLNIKTRSPSDIMHYLSTGVKVPDMHLVDGEAVLTRDGTGCPFDWQQVTGDLFQVCASKRKPKAKLRVKYRKHWFYIANNDHASKRSLLLLANILALEQVESRQSAPVLAIPL